MTYIAWKRCAAISCIIWSLGSYSAIGNIEFNCVRFLAKFWVSDWLIAEVSHFRNMIWRKYSHKSYHTKKSWSITDSWIRNRCVMPVISWKLTEFILLSSACSWGSSWSSYHSFRRNQWKVGPSWCPNQGSRYRWCWSKKKRYILIPLFLPFPFIRSGKKLANCLWLMVQQLWRNHWQLEEHCDRSTTTALQTVTPGLFVFLYHYKCLCLMQLLEFWLVLVFATRHLICTDVHI